jgi:hypothetical protein
MNTEHATVRSCSATLAVLLRCAAQGALLTAVVALWADRCSVDRLVHIKAGGVVTSSHSCISNIVGGQQAYSSSWLQQLFGQHMQMLMDM